MLCFVFAALVVILDQFFKRWVVITLSSGGEQVLIPNVFSLIYVENTGAAFSILADQRWLLASIAFVMAIVLIAILLRYTDGFWGTLGLASVLGGTIGNLIDRVFNGYVVDMFRWTLFFEFAIFNIADIFITLGVITFCIHFITLSYRTQSDEKKAVEHMPSGDTFEFFDMLDGRDMPENDDFSDTKVIPSLHTETYSDPTYAEQPDYDDFQDTGYDDYDDPIPDQDAFEHSSTPQFEFSSTQQVENTSILDELNALESNLDAFDDDYSIDELLREYGFENDDP